jgi:hypothetical protein
MSEKSGMMLFMSPRDTLETALKAYHSKTPCERSTAKPDTQENQEKNPVKRAKRTNASGSTKG